MRLIDGHLRILIAVQQQQGWIVFIHVKHRAGELGQFLHLIRRISKQQLQCRHADAEAMRGGLAEDTGQVAGAVVARNRLDVGRLIGMPANGAFQGLYAVAGADERGEMAAGGIARDADAIRIVAVPGLIGTQPADGAFAVLDQRGKFRHRAQAIIDTGHRIAAFHQRREWHEILAACTPRSAVNPHDERRVLGGRQIEVQRQGVIIDLGVLQVRDFLERGGGHREGGEGGQQQSGQEAHVISPLNPGVPAGFRDRTCRRGVARSRSSICRNNHWRPL